ncbi:2,3-bisphosphoglycerate-independent phosphoglycerate mutase [Coxiella endosymbiont of Amblyomma americanum]|uniref:2,3-bisphosphoglycerate-independent phosphoglycerate mutase n=1 Tax=Coxiella endosymbiont of Amblyomma americanum TaxID=325775 RepID=UPI00069015BB|nr:2,3-bisphosphoglycerate-independent phosphoglycerate mutase [Coxiella endosymbiont of Amblyomma americanum]
MQCNNKSKTKRIKPIVLIILDGFGFSKSKDTTHNAIRLAKTPTLDTLWTHYPHTLLKASGSAVGLPKRQVGNSEAGHLHIGSGRKVLQDVTRIDKSVSTGTFFENTVLVNAINQANQNNKAIHIIGLLSHGGVHSRDTQIVAMIELAYLKKAKKIYLHAILDGRDTPPKSAILSIKKINTKLRNYAQCPCTQSVQSIQYKIVSLIGRYYAMDRDKRWDRTQKAYDLLTQGIAARRAKTAEEAITLAYKRNETDEFIRPTSICYDRENPVTIQDGDTIIFMNFRADRAKQLTNAFTDGHFTGFKRRVTPKLTNFVTLTSYISNPSISVAFPSCQLNKTLGECLSILGLRQLRLAETEKYAHVTYFLNGRKRIAFPGEDRKLIPSPKVATYDLQPEMSATAITNELVKTIKNGRYDFIVCNFANPDMVGHTGNEIATKQAIHTIDNCLQRVLETLKFSGGEMLITADHGNAEKMFDEKTKQPHTAHTSNLTPLIYVGRKAKFKEKVGALYDIAPTILFLMGINKPSEMTGRNLIILLNNKQ